MRIADAEHAVQVIPESADAWYNLGDVLFHFGRLADIPEPEVRARQALEQAFQRDSLFGGPIQHLAALTWVAGDTAAQRLWTRRLIALDSAGEGVPTARWNLLQTTRDEAGIAAFLAELDSGPAQVPQGFCSSVRWTASRSPIVSALFDAVHRLSATKAERTDVATARAHYLWNLGRPAEAAKWIDTLATLDRTPPACIRCSAPSGSAAAPADTTLMDRRAARQLAVLAGRCRRRPAAAAVLAGPGRAGLHQCLLSPRGRRRRGQAGARSQRPGGRAA